MAEGEEYRPFRVCRNGPEIPYDCKTANMKDQVRRSNAFSASRLCRRADSEDLLMTSIKSIAFLVLSAPCLHGPFAVSKATDG